MPALRNYVLLKILESRMVTDPRRKLPDRAGGSVYGINDKPLF